MLDVAEVKNIMKSRSQSAADIRMYYKKQVIDQGSQFTGDLFTSELSAHDIKISMDSKGRALDNVFIERLWRSLKYEYVYLYAPDSGKELWKGINDYFYFYNFKRPHQSLGYQTPAAVYGISQINEKDL